jgi:hypothetical protein
MYLIARKNHLIQDKKGIFYFLLSCIILAIPALLGFMDYTFMPSGYLLLSGLYLWLGYVNLNVMAKFIEGIKGKPYGVEFLCQFMIMFVGVALFSMVFNLCNELQYGIWASTCVLSFIFPSLFRKAYSAYMDIPLEVYNIWSYEQEVDEMDTEKFDTTRIIVVELELFKQIQDIKPLNIKAKAAENAPFGVWFSIFIKHYNTKSPNFPIVPADAENSYGWMFYVNAFLFRKKHIDPELSFAANGIKEKNVIIAKRVQRTENE